MSTPIPLLFQPYQRGAGGEPSTGAAMIAPPISSYTHSICAVGGFEACNVSFQGTLDDALYWLNSLMSTVVVYGPELTTTWEGFISTVSVTLGQEKIDLSLDDMANAVVVRYQPGIGAQTATAFITDAGSIATYGRKELIYGGSGMITAAAETLRDTLLDQRFNPIAKRSSSIATGGGRDEVTISLQCTGWYYALGWVTTVSTTTAVLGTTTQLAALIASYNGTNDFFSTSTLDIQGSGLSDTQYIEPYTTFRAKIERLMSLGNSSGQRIAYGVYEGQVFKAKTWAGATPSVIDYQRYLSDDLLYNAYGGRIDMWDARPDTMYQVIELLDAGPISSMDGVASYYVERVTCTIDEGGCSLRLEPARSTELDVLLARIRN